MTWDSSSSGNEESRVYLLRCGRRASQRRDRVESSRGTTGRRLGRAAFNMQEELDSLDIFRKITRIRFAGHIQPDARKRMDARVGISAAADARDHSAVSTGARSRCLRRSGGATSRTWWCPWFRTSIARCFRACRRHDPARPFVTILTDFADYPAALLAGEAGPLCHLRDRASLRAGDCDSGKSAGEDVSRVGDDLAPGFLQGTRA